MSVKIIFSCQADFHGIALQEILGINNTAFISWLDGGVGLLEYHGAFDEFSVAAREKRLIFTRHIFPAEYIVSCADAEKCTEKFIMRMDKNKSFSVQLRAVNNISNPRDLLKTNAGPGRLYPCLSRITLHIPGFRSRKKT
jgi:hypothetical protein